MNARWLTLRNQNNRFYSLDGKGITITPLNVNITQKESPAAIFCRQQHTNFTAQTSLTFSPKSSKDLAGFVLLQNEEYNFVFGVTMLGDKPAITLTRSDKASALIASAFLPSSDANVRLKIEGNGRYYNFYYALPGGDWQTLAQGVDAVNLSTSRSGGFIGACIGLYATSGN